MRRTLFRLFVAAAFSLGGFGGTWYWYHSTEKPLSEVSQQNPIAFVHHTKDEISRRPVTKLLWQNVTDGDPLFPGEALRTSSMGEARIQFMDGSHFIDVEPDSLIVLNQADHEILLDLMDGSFFVSNEGKDSSESTGITLTLNAGNGKLDLSQTTANLSKSAKGIDLQVIKGAASALSSDGQRIQIAAGSRGTVGDQGPDVFKAENLRVLSPPVDKPLFTNPDAPQPTVFEWQGFNAGSNISVQYGKSRKDLKTMGETTGNRLSSVLLPGRYFWKLVAKDPRSQQVLAESATFKLDISARMAPAAMAPENKAVLAAKERVLRVEFHWVKPPAAQGVQFEIWRDPGLQQLIYSRDFLSESTSTLNLTEGDYYWRVSGIYEGLDKVINGKVQIFNVTPQEKLKPPISINWSVLDDKTPQYYLTQPAANLSWNSGQKDQVKIWRLRLGETEEELISEKAKTLETNNLTIKTPVAKPGRYLAMVEALDEQHQVLAKSQVKNIEIAPQPTLEAPQFEPRHGEIKADNQGHLPLQWTAINGAKDYSVILLDNDGREIKSLKSVRNIASMTSLLPGSYKITVYATDQYGRRGAKGATRTVMVPGVSSLMAPKLKKIKVK